MNFLHSQPTGIDYYIQNLQTMMYRDLPDRLGVDPDKWNLFGRVLRNNLTDGTNPGFIPEAYYGGEYIAGDGRSNRGGLFFESGFIVSFFGTAEPAKDSTSGYSVVTTELIFFVDLSIVAPSGITDTGQRLDEVVTNIVYDYVQLNGNSFRPKQVVKDVDEVLKRYSGAQKKKSLIQNMQPLYCFKIIGDLVYNRFLKTT